MGYKKLEYEVELAKQEALKKFENGIFRYFYCEKCHKSCIKLKGEGHVIGKVRVWYCDQCQLLYISDKLKVKEVIRSDLTAKVREQIKENTSEGWAKFKGVKSNNSGAYSRLHYIYKGRPLCGQVETTETVQWTFPKKILEFHKKCGTCKHTLETYSNLDNMSER